VKKVIPLICLALILPTGANAASSKPTPKATAKAVATKKPLATATLKPITKTTSVAGGATAKATTKKVVKKYKRYVRKKVKPLKSPAPKWPPANFKPEGSIYAKVPSATELIEYTRVEPFLTNDSIECRKVTCGAVLLAAETGCNWWQVDATLSGPNRDGSTGRENYGTIKALALGSPAKKIIAVYLKSKEPLQQGLNVGGITARCWASDKPENVPSNSYTALAANGSTK
jgi:hypothetical protein